MAESVYKIVELVGTSTESWEKAATAAVSRASASLRDLRVAEVSELDLQIEDGQVRAYGAKVKISFKYDGDEWPGRADARHGRATRLDQVALSMMGAASRPSPSRSAVTGRSVALGDRVGDAHRDRE